MSSIIERRELLLPSDLKPSREAIDALKGTISEPLETISNKPGLEGQVVRVRIALEGAGLYDLKDWRDGREWSGITNHVLLSARFSTAVACLMDREGQNVYPQRVLDGMVVSHAGRRRWDEANWYPNIVPNATETKLISNETLGMQLVQGKVSQEAFELVVALGHNVEGFSVDPSIYNSLDFRIAIYIDHRTSQRYEPLHTRMGDFFLGNFYPKGEVTSQLKERVYASMKDMIDRQKSFRMGQEGVIEVTLDEADRVSEALGARSSSARLSRRELMRLILQDADTEALLIQAKINSDELNEETIPMPKWEDDFRREYVEASKEDIKNEITTRTKDQAMSREATLIALFPGQSWWDQYARK